MTPPSPNVNVKQRVRDFLLSSRLNAWKKKTTGRAGGAKLSRSSWCVAIPTMP